MTTDEKEYLVGAVVDSTGMESRTASFQEFMVNHSSTTSQAMWSILMGRLGKTDSGIGSDIEEKIQKAFDKNVEKRKSPENFTKSKSAGSGRKSTESVAAASDDSTRDKGIEDGLDWAEDYAQNNCVEEVISDCASLQQLIDKQRCVFDERNILCLSFMAKTIPVKRRYVGSQRKILSRLDSL